MPELPDVETFKRYLNQTSLNKKIKEVLVKDKSLLYNISQRKLTTSLKGNKFTTARRHGKYLFAKTKDSWLVLHFGMTGFLKYFKNENEQPDHVRLQINFSNSYSLAFDNQRKLGSIGLTKDIDSFIKKKELGRDPLDDNFDFDTFYELLKGKKGSLKSFFMNQKYIAGLGNVYTDELLFHSYLHPKSKVEKTDRNTAKKLYRNLNKILEKAIDVSAKRKEFPRTYLIKYRNDGENCPRCEGKIKQIKISGRSTYYCDKHQEKL